ncbi:MAG: RICIN domain-containing protein [Faecalibacterium prausnitzii]|nr:RICIN domain-containing protein [Faecalibacterium prausnitzii]
MKTVAQTVIEADHFYTIAAHTGNVIQAVEGTKEAGTVRLGKYEHKPEQEWSFIRVGDGIYRIRNRASGKLLDLTMTGTANGTWLHLWEDVGGTSQMWTVQPTPEGTVRLRSSWAGGKCVDTVGMGAAVGTVLQIWQEVSGANDQLWTIAEVKERAKRAAKKAEAPAVEAAAEAAPAAEKAPAKKTAARKPRTTKKAVAAKAEEGKAETAAPAEKPAKPARKTAEKKTAAKAAEKAEPAKAEVPAEEKPTAEKPKRKCAPRKKKETV